MHPQRGEHLTTSNKNSLSKYIKQSSTAATISKDPLRQPFSHTPIPKSLFCHHHFVSLS